MAANAASQPARPTRATQQSPPWMIPGISRAVSAVARQKLHKDLQQLRSTMTAAMRPPAYGRCHLLRLATETRFDIYRFVFEGAWLVISEGLHFDDIVITPRKGLHKKISILFTCQTIHTEARDVLGEELHLCLFAPGPESRMIPSTVREKYLRSIQSLEISPEAADFDPTVFPNLKHLHLQYVTDDDGPDDILLKENGSIETHIETIKDRLHRNNDQGIVNEWMNYCLHHAGSAFVPATMFEASYRKDSRIWMRNLVRHYYDECRSYSMTSGISVFILIYLEGDFATQGMHLMLGMQTLIFDMDSHKVISRYLIEEDMDWTADHRTIGAFGPIPDFDINEDLGTYLQIRFAGWPTPTEVPETSYDSWDEDSN